MRDGFRPNCPKISDQERRKQMERSLRKLVVPIVLVAVLVVALPSIAVSGSAGLTQDELVLLSHLPDQQIGKEYPKGETINVGFLAALSGPDAGWGLPGLTGNNIWIDTVNKTGGLLVGGKRYPLKMHAFDDEANASKALQGARQLVLEHEVKFINAIGGDPANATAPFLTKHKVIYASLVPTDMHPKRPYVVAGGDVTPQCNMFNALLAKMVLPSEKELGRPLKYALTTQDDIMSRQVGAWEIGAAIAMGFEIVYEKFFSVDTTDFAPIATALMATNPDVISLCEAWPEYQSCTCRDTKGWLSRTTPIGKPT
jgi:branched-chain amino acid transport system substrate-binding protein